MSDVAIEVYGLVKKYAGRAVVDGVSFSAGRGRLLALLGPNGAGKTTTVEICEGYRRPDAGRVRVLGLDPVADHARLAPMLGVMLQQGGVYPSAKPLEVLRLFASFFADPVPPDQLLDRMGLRAVAGTPYRRLSGGQQQRLSMALAVIGRPSVAFLDEPTTGLDPQARAEVWELVSELRTEGGCVVLTTHSMEEAERLADDVVIIDGGKVIAAGTPAALTGATQRVMSFDAPPAQDIDGLAAALPPGCTVTQPRRGHFVIAGAVDPAAVAAATAWCAAAGVVAENLRVEARSLEDVFLDLTGRELRP
ncbi:MAG: ABC transporter ATP-binding protein [Actinomycetota bacterium]